MKIVLLGKGAAGKDYLRKRFIERGARYGVSYTSRQPREGEVNGKDYLFISREEFEQRIANNEFVEYQEFNGWYYGMTKDVFEDCDAMILNVEGLALLSPELRAKCFVIYLDIDKETRLQRLSERNDNQDSIERRIQADDNQFIGFTDYDLKITNPDF
jgi:guanylate kinase